MVRGGKLVLLTLPLVLMLAAVACARPGPGPRMGATEGGKVVIAAEQWPECLNVVTTCSIASWMHWAVTDHVLPRAMILDTKGNFVASPLLTEAPTMANGGLKQNPFTVTFKLNPEAVWEDGTPITSGDFEFTWRAVLETTGAFSTLGYDKIDSIDTSDPKTAVITFREPYANWGDLFGGAAENGYVLKRAAFGDKVNLKDEMIDEIAFSGGPFKLASFSPDQAVLVRNDTYWDEKALFDQVTMVPRTDQSTEVNALMTGEVVAIFPQAKSPDFRKQLEGQANIKAAFGAGTIYEGLWLNLDAFPLNDKAVRQALAHAIDRQAVVDFLVKPNLPEAKVLNCGGWVPSVGDWCDDSDYARYTYDPQKAKQILQGAGWTLGPDGIFTKAARSLTIPFATTAGNKGREDTQALLKEKARAAGIDLQIQNSEAGQLFENKLPRRDFVMVEYANVVSADPSVTRYFASDAIPSEANGFKGENWVGWRNEEATWAMKDSDRELDPARRLTLIRKIGDLEAEDLPWIPLYQKPLITAWRSDRIDGPIGAYTSTPLGGFWNMSEWFVKMKGRS